MSKRFRESGSEGARSDPGVAGAVDTESPPVLIVDSVRRCVEANDAASRLLGLTRAQLVGLDVDDLRLPDGHLLVLPRLEDTPPEPGADSDVPPAEDGLPRRRPSEREREVLALLARGSTDAKIAESLGLSPATVQTHVRNAKAKLGARTRAQAVALALVGGLIELD